LFCLEPQKCLALTGGGLLERSKTHQFQYPLKLHTRFAARGEPGNRSIEAHIINDAKVNLETVSLWDMATRPEWQSSGGARLFLPHVFTRPMLYTSQHFRVEPIAQLTQEWSG